MPASNMDFMYEMKSPVAERDNSIYFYVGTYLISTPMRAIYDIPNRAHSKWHQAHVPKFQVATRFFIKLRIPFHSQHE